MAFKFLDNQLNPDELAQEVTLSLINTKLSGVLNTNVINEIDISGNINVNDLSANILNDISVNVLNSVYDVSNNIVKIANNNVKTSVNTIDGLQDISGCLPVYDARQDLYPDNDLNVNIRNQSVFSTNVGNIDSFTTRVLLANNHPDISCNLVQDASCNVRQPGPVSKPRRH